MFFFDKLIKDVSVVLLQWNFYGNLILMCRIYGKNFMYNGCILTAFRPIENFILFSRYIARTYMLVINKVGKQYMSIRNRLLINKVGNKRGLRNILMQILKRNVNKKDKGS